MPILKSLYDHTTTFYEHDPPQPKVLGQEMLPKVIINEALGECTALLEDQISQKKGSSKGTRIKEFLR
jgi:hypothetical protein